jgi:hypothetical protein
VQQRIDQNKKVASRQHSQHSQRSRKRSHERSHKHSRGGH